MSLDKFNQRSTVGHGISDLANLTQRECMSVRTSENQIASSYPDMIDLRDRWHSTPLQIAEEIRSLRKQAQEIMQAKHLAGKALAHEAVAYLYGVADAHEIEFVVGHSDPALRQTANEHYEGYAAHLDFLSEQGVVTYHEADGLYVAYGTGRILHKTELDLDDVGQPAVILYRDSETQRALEIAIADPIRLIAEA